MSCKPTGRDCTNWKKIVNRVLTAQAITEARRVVDVDAELGWRSSWTRFIAGRSFRWAVNSHPSPWNISVAASGQLHSSAFLTLPCEMMRNAAILTMAPARWIPPRLRASLLLGFLNSKKQRPIFKVFFVSKIKPNSLCCVRIQHVLCWQLTSTGLFDNRTHLLLKSYVDFDSEVFLPANMLWHIASVKDCSFHINCYCFESKLRPQCDNHTV